MNHTTHTANPSLIETTIEVREVLSDRNCKVALPNGRIMFGYLSARASSMKLTPGLRARAHLNVADFERAILIEPATD